MPKDLKRQGQARATSTLGRQLASRIHCVPACGDVPASHRRPRHPSRIRSSPITMQSVAMQSIANRALR